VELQIMRARNIVFPRSRTWRPSTKKSWRFRSHCFWTHFSETSLTWFLAWKDYIELRYR